MTKLLHKPLKAFAVYALIILAVSIPVYVLVVDYIWINELDENNWLTLQHIKQRLQSKAFSNDEIENLNRIWGELHPGVSILKIETKSIQQDSIYEIVRANVYDLDDEEDRFRGLASYVEINGTPYLLAIETNIEESDETFLAIAVVTFLFFVVLITGFILLNRRIATKTWKPFYQTLEALHSFELSKDNTIDLPVTDISEFKELHQSLEQLVNNNVATYQLQKAFTENASHELQTPIALLKSKLDLLLQEKDVTPERSEILNAIEAPLSRLSRINKNLLVLAKVENQQYSEKEQLDVIAFIGETQSLFEDYITDKALILQSKTPPTFIVSANAFLLETLLHNLFSNAIRHTPIRGSINLSLENKTLSFSNSGNTALDAQHLFERFFSASKDKVSSGLGLAIIKEITTKYNWQITYRFENEFHIFSITF